MKRHLIVPMLLVVLSASVPACSGNGATDEAVDSTEVAPSSASPTSHFLDVPAGWHLAADGLSVARESADLGAETPVGPRVVVTVDASVDASGLLAAFVEDDRYGLVTGPDAVTFAGAPGVSITLRWERPAGAGAAGVDRIIEFVTISSPDGAALLFELSAPVSEWEDIAPTLEHVASR